MKEDCKPNPADNNDSQHLYLTGVSRKIISATTFGNYTSCGALIDPRLTPITNLKA